MLRPGSRPLTVQSTEDSLLLFNQPVPDGLGSLSVLNSGLGTERHGIKVGQKSEIDRLLAALPSESSLRKCGIEPPSFHGSQRYLRR